MSQSQHESFDLEIDEDKAEYLMSSLDDLEAARMLLYRLDEEGRSRIAEEGWAYGNPEIMGGDITEVGAEQLRSALYAVYAARFRVEMTLMYHDEPNEARQGLHPLDGGEIAPQPAGPYGDPVSEIHLITEITGPQREAGALAADLSSETLREPTRLYRRRPTRNNARERRDRRALVEVFAGDTDRPGGDYDIGEVITYHALDLAPAACHFVWDAFLQPILQSREEV